MRKSIQVILLMAVSFCSFANAGYSVSQADLKLPESWSFGEVVGIVENQLGHKFVFNRGAHQLLEFDKAGNFVKEIGAGQFSKPHGLRLDSYGNIWTTDSQTHLVQRFAPNGQVTMILGMKGKASKGWFDRDYNLVLFNEPHDVAFDKDDNIYVVDKGNHRIVKLNSDGLLQKMWGSKGYSEGEFNFAHSIVIDHQDRILVADRENKRIQLFDLNGLFLEQWTNVGYPYVLVLSKKALWFTDARNEQIKQLDLNGVLLKTINGAKGRNPTQFGFAHGLYISPEQHIFTTQVLNWSVLELKPSM